MIKSNKINSTPALVFGETGLIQTVSAAGIPVYAGSEVRNNPSLYSRFVKRKFYFSSYESEEFIKELCALGKQFPEKPVLLSDDDRLILNISRHRKVLSRYYHLSFPSIKTVDCILDKRKFCELAEQRKLPVPQSFEVSNDDDLNRASGRLHYPGIIKPAFRHFWYHDQFEDIVGFPYKKAYRFEDRVELAKLYGKLRQIHPEVVVQEYIEGDDDQHYSVNMAVGTHNEILGYYIARKVRVYPITAGMGSYVVTVVDKDVLDQASYVVKALGLEGLVNIQFKKDVRTGVPKLIELHARNSVWNYLGAAAGINLPELYYRHLLGLPFDNVHGYKTGVKYINLRRDIRAFIQYRRNGQLTLARWLFTFRGKVVFERNFVKDPMPIVMGYGYRLKDKWSKPDTLLSGNSSQSLNAGKSVPLMVNKGNLTK